MTTPRRRPQPDDWERMRPQITMLYKNEKWRMQDVVVILVHDHGFQITERMLRQRIKEWNLSKNLRQREVDAALRKIRNSQQAGQTNPSVIYHDRRINLADIQEHYRKKLENGMTVYDMPKPSRSAAPTPPGMYDSEFFPFSGDGSFGLERDGSLENAAGSTPPTSLDAAVPPPVDQDWSSPYFDPEQGPEPLGITYPVLQAASTPDHAVDRTSFDLNDTANWEIFDMPSTLNLSFEPPPNEVLAVGPSIPAIEPPTAGGRLHQASPTTEHENHARGVSHSENAHQSPRMLPRASGTRSEQLIADFEAFCHSPKTTPGVHNANLCDDIACFAHFCSYRVFNEGREPRRASPTWQILSDVLDLSYPNRVEEFVHSLRAIIEHEQEPFDIRKVLQQLTNEVQMHDRSPTDWRPPAEQRGIDHVEQLMKYGSCRQSRKVLDGNYNLRINTQRLVSAVGAPSAYRILRLPWRQQLETLALQYHLLLIQSISSADTDYSMQISKDLAMTLWAQGNLRHAIDHLRQAMVMALNGKNSYMAKVAWLMILDTHQKSINEVCSYCQAEESDTSSCQLGFKSAIFTVGFHTLRKMKLEYSLRHCSIPSRIDDVNMSVDIVVPTGLHLSREAGHVLIRPQGRSTLANEEFRFDIHEEGWIIDGYIYRKIRTSREIIGL